MSKVGEHLWLRVGPLLVGCLLVRCLRIRSGIALVAPVGFVHVVLVRLCIRVGLRLLLRHRPAALRVVLQRHLILELPSLLQLCWDLHLRRYLHLHFLVYP